jgi:hypothetical protein
MNRDIVAGPRSSPDVDGESKSEAQSSFAQLAIVSSPFDDLDADKQALYV